jgi:hypothetical protein
MLLLPRFSNKPGIQFTFQVLAAIACCGLQYVWLYNDGSFLFRVWGFSLLPAYTLPLLFVFFLFQFGGTDRFSFLSFLGKVSHWIQAIMYPLAVFAVTYLVFLLGGYETDSDWKWTTLALSSASDLPVLFVWTFPMTIGCILVWLTPQSSFASRLHPIPRLLLSAALFVLANGTLLYFLSEKAAPIVGIGASVFCFALGSFVYRIQEHGSVLPSAFSLILIAVLFVLAFGSQIKDLNHVFFGYSIDSVPALLKTKGVASAQYKLYAAAFLFLASLFVRTKQ